MQFGLTGNPLVDHARRWLAERLHGTWDGEYLAVDGATVYVDLDPEAELDHGLWLSDIEMHSHPRAGTGTGTRVILSLKDFCDQEGIRLSVGPVVNRDYWASHRFPWLETSPMDLHGDPVLTYPPSDRRPRENAFMGESAEADKPTPEDIRQMARQASHPDDRATLERMADAEQRHLDKHPRDPSRWSPND